MKHFVVVCPFRAQVVNHVLPRVSSIEEFDHLVDGVAVRAFEAHGREPHGDDAVGNEGMLA